MSLLTNKHYYLAPCPYYDVDVMQRWLEAEALEGYILTEQGFLFGIATFEKKEPCHIRYRLEPKEVLDWSAESLFPSAEARELCEEYGWTYVTDRGKFFIYCSETETAREMNTDAKVQAMALKPMRDHARNHFWSSLYWIIGYPLIRCLVGQMSLLRMCIDMGTWLFIMTLSIGVWALVKSVLRLRYIAKLRCRLNQEGSIASPKVIWTQENTLRLLHKKRITYWFSNLTYAFLILIWFFCMAHVLERDVSYTNRVPLEEYIAAYSTEYHQTYGVVPQNIFPFADLKELAEKSMPELFIKSDVNSTETSEELLSSPLTFVPSDMYPGSMNYVDAKNDLLASTVIRFNQNGSVTFPDGRELEGILDVNYYDTTMPWVAKVLAWEYLKKGKTNKHYSEIPLPELPVDEAYCFTAYSPTLILRKGDVVMMVELVQFQYEESDYTLKPAQWARIFVENMR